MSSVSLPADFSDWPVPSSEALAVCDALVARIRARLDRSGGLVPFAEFMELALYEPGLGYYSNGLRKFGKDGDFITAPELTPLFGRSVASFVLAVLEDLGDGDVLEFGAGSGVLAVQLLAELEQLNCLPRRYCILERSAALQMRQRELIAEKLPHLFDRVEWLDALPEGFRGVMLGNEVVDASPVTRFRWRQNGVQEWCVTWRDDRFCGEWQETKDVGLSGNVNNLARQYDWDDDYISELDVSLKAWVSSVAHSLSDGALLLIDYGSPRAERYHTQRSTGTLMCHYRHRAHGDPLILPGLQDITSYVDFTSIAEAGTDAGLGLEGFASQAHFLLDCGIDQLLVDADPDGSARYFKQAQEAKQLLMPGEMGERFKCMALRRGIAAGLPGFRRQDLRGSL